MRTDGIKIIEKISAYIEDVTTVEKDKIQNHSLIFNEGYFDSMGFVLLITFIEEEFSIQITDADLVEENFESINAIADFVIRKTQ